MKLKLIILIPLAIVCVPLIASEKNEKDFTISVAYSGHTHEEENYFLYAKATFQHLNDELQQAFATFQKLQEKDAPVATYNGFIRYLFDAQKFAQIVQVPENIWIQFKDDVQIQLIRAKTLMQVGKNDKAESLLDTLTEQFADNEQVMYYAVVFKTQQKKIPQALELVDKALANKNLSQKRFLFYFLRSKILFALGKHQQAAEFIEKSVGLFPRFAKGWLFRGLVYQQQGKIDAAIAGYERFLDIAGHDESVEKQLVNLLFTHGRYAHAAARLKKMKSDQPEYFFDLALIEWRAGEQKKALASVDKALAKQEDFLKARLLKVEILLGMKKQDKLMSYMTAWLEKHPGDVHGYQTLMLILKANVANKKVIATLKKVSAKAKDKTLPLLALCDVYLQTNEYDNALSFYKKLIPLAKNDVMKGKIYYQMGYIYFNQGKNKDLEITLSKAVKLPTVLPSVYNLLAYHLADRGVHLNKALRYADLALKTSPDSHYFLDTKGYVLLKIGKKAEASKFFHKALVQSPNDQTVRKHYALSVEQPL